MRMPNQNCNYQTPECAGSIIVFVAILLTVLAATVAMIIDLSLVTTAAEQSRNYVRMASLAALEAYYGEGADITEPERREKALERANDILRSSFHLEFPGQARQFIQLRYPSQGETEGDGGFGEPIMQSGKWYYAESDAAECGGAPPCFVQSATEDETANAFRISGSLPSAHLTPFYEAAMGVGEHSIKADTVASVMPRHGCFMVDLSSSITRQTHVLRTAANQLSDPNGGRGSEFAFSNAVRNGTVRTRHDDEYDVLVQATIDGDLRPNVNVGGYDIRHYQGDYGLKKRMNDSSYLLNASYALYHPNPVEDPSYSANGDDLWYNVDMFRDDNYGGPEPLSTIMHGLHSAVDTFKKRSVAGDELCLIFYDNRLRWPRIVKLTDNFDYLLDLTKFDVPPLTPIADDDIAIGNVALASESPGFMRAVRHGLFPSHVSQESSSFTNMGMALSEALAQLDAGRQEGVPTSDFLVFIGDGLSNCTSFPPKCSNDLSTHLDSLDEIRTTIRTKVISGNIPVHFIVVGKDVAPHTVSIAKEPSSTECMTDKEARTSSVPYVIGGNTDGEPFTTFDDQRTAFDNTSAQFPYFQINAELYEMAKATRGIWAPLRYTDDTCVPRTTCSDTPTRQLTDPDCKSLEDQMLSYMDEIIGDNPYVIVK